MRNEAEAALIQGSERILSRCDAESFLGHLLRLDPESLRDRFNAMVSKGFLREYAGRCFREGVTVVGFVDGGLVLAAGELHATSGDEAEAEAAFSVEKSIRGRGVGGLLFDRVVEIAGSSGVSRLEITTHADNLAMRGLARSRGLSLEFEGTEGHGRLVLPRASGLRAA